MEATSSKLLVPAQATATLPDTGASTNLPPSTLVDDFNDLSSGSNLDVRNLAVFGNAEELMLVVCQIW
jgi:hypothetical protein